MNDSGKFVVVCGEGCPLCHQVYSGKCKHPIMDKFSVANKALLDSMKLPGEYTNTSYGSGWIKGGACDPKEGPQ